MRNFALSAMLALAAAGTASAHGIKSDTDASKTAAFDITGSEATTDGRLATFALEVAGVAGSMKPVSIGKLTGSKVGAYVWPTSLDPAVVGFDPKSGILALAITAHPDFDDTPLYDENQDGDPANDGADWHSHWVVLTKEKACGAGLKVRDVSPGVDLLPETAPYLPIALDSPGVSPILKGRTAQVTVPLKNAESVSFDAVTAELQINENGEKPLLCVTGVYDVASGDLSLPGKVVLKK
ncbi:hypothetical protein [Parasphingorhabdus sp.]|uniref:hypothetical protein n=1 Tax=Parasphingorhabdus sp. TaxID=2709688 RepID=UPI003D27D9CF